MTFAQYAMLLALSVSSVGIASAQEHSPRLADPTSEQALTTLAQRAELFEAKAQLARQCAKGLRLTESVMNLTSLGEEREDVDWSRETFFLVRMWFTQEQQDEWYFAGQEFADYAKIYAEEDHTKAEAVEMYKRVFASIMNAQVAVLEKLSGDLDARIHRIQEPQSSD